MADYFTKQKNSEMMTIALKGEHLEEFCKLLTDFHELHANMLLGKIAKENPQFAQILDQLKAMQLAVSDFLDKPGAAEHGLDGNDLDGLLQPLKGRIINFDNQYNTIFRNFSMCLAVQEKQEDKLLKLHKKDLSRTYDVIKDPKNTLHCSSENEVYEKCASVAFAIVRDQQHLALLKKRNSPVAQLSEQFLYGKEYPRTRQPNGGDYHILTLMIAACTKANLLSHTGKMVVDGHRQRIIKQVMREQELSDDSIQLP